MTRTFMAAFDGRAPSVAAVRFADHVAAAAHAQLVVVTVPTPGLHPGEPLPQLPDPLALTELAPGEPVDVLCAFARERQASLLAIGARSSGPFGRLLADGVAARIALRPPCALAIVPARAAAAPAPRPTIAVAVSPGGSGRPGLIAGAALARALGGRLVVLTVREDAAGEERDPTGRRRHQVPLADRVQSALRRSVGHDTGLRVLYGDAGSGLIAASRDDVDVLVLADRRRTTADPLGDVVSAVLDRAACPVVLVTAASAARLAQDLDPATVAQPA